MIRASLYSASLRLAGAALFVWVPRIVLATEPFAIEVFTTSDRPVAMLAPTAMSGVDVNVVEVDTLERINARLSAGLPADATTAQAAVQKRLSSLQRDEIAPLRHAAIGLATASQLGVDRTPAIVFDKHGVIYGLTDLTEAIRRYRAWRRTSD